MLLIGFVSIGITGDIGLTAVLAAKSSQRVSTTIIAEMVSLRQAYYAQITKPPSRVMTMLL
jgi:hypothetical protein